MYTRLLSLPTNSKSVFLFGPRATGKSSWLKLHFPHCLTFNLLHSETYNTLLANPSQIENLIPKNYTDWIIIDEIQRVPELLNEVHRLIEDKKLKFILTGSNARKLRRDGVNLLAGRAITRYCYPLTTQELKNDFKLERALQYGTLPMAVTEKNPQDYLSSYISTYLREEVQQEGLTRNLTAFSRFLQAASFSQASLLNISEVARDCHVDRKQVESYFEILEDLLIAIRLPAFNKMAKRRLITSNKFFYFDAGVYRTIRPKGPLDSPEFIDGAALETLFLQEARALNSYLNLNLEIFHWHAQDGYEVDFVLYGEQGVFAFEIKRSKKFRSADLSGLKLFLKDYPMAKAYFLYGGTQSQYFDQIEIHPFEAMLKNLPQLLMKQSD